MDNLTTQDKNVPVLERALVRLRESATAAGIASGLTTFDAHLGSSILAVALQAGAQALTSDALAVRAVDLALAVEAEVIKRAAV